MDNCCSLPDVQNRLDTRGVSLERVGLTNMKFPTSILRKDGTTSDISTKVVLFANLPEKAKGHNLSRFSEVLVLFGQTHKMLSSITIPDLLIEMQKKLGSRDVYTKFEFDYYIDKKAPVSKKVAPMAYTCAMTGIKKNGSTFFILEVNVTAASVCPCSKEMSLVTNLNIPFELKIDLDPKVESSLKGGIGDKVGMGAHNQRSQIKVEALLDPEKKLWIEDLVKLIEAEASAPTYPILKRPDEKFVTELGYNNAKFSEDIARDIQLSLQKKDEILAWSLKVSNEESIHPYNVVSSSKSNNWNFY